MITKTDEFTQSKQETHQFDDEIREFERDIETFRSLMESDEKAMEKHIRMEWVLNDREREDVMGDQEVKRKQEWIGLWKGKISRYEKAIEKLQAMG